MRTLNLGILAHVDAGKTTLTERLLHLAGVTDSLGSVDAGTTQTDSLDLERRRGITIRSAAVSFTVGDVVVNLIDTPGHPDFIAEVDRCLSVLDGVVLVVSAVEGVQSQTIVLMRALQRLGIPAVFFVNKIDRAGADPDRVLATIRERLTPHVVRLGKATGLGTRAATYHPYVGDDSVLTSDLLDVLLDVAPDLVDGLLTDPDQAEPVLLRTAFDAQSRAATAHGLILGSALSGAGVGDLLAALPDLLPADEPDLTGPPVGRVFKVERGPRGDKVAYVRLFTGSLRVRDHLDLGAGRSAVVTDLQVLTDGNAVRCGVAPAGRIARLGGMAQIRVGDVLGVPRRADDVHFAPPTLETAVAPCEPARAAELHAALGRLADQDPLIGLRVDTVRNELHLSLYGEVQQEVIQQTLAEEYGLAIEYRQTTLRCVERVTGVGRAGRRLGQPGNAYPVTIGLTVGPGPAAGGIAVELAVDRADIPLYVYESVPKFHEALSGYIARSLQQGLAGWPVLDATVTLTECGYVAPSTTSGSVRHLTVDMLREALTLAGTQVCAPVQHFRLEAPADALPAVVGLLAQHRAVPDPPSVIGSWLTIEGHLPAAEVRGVQRELPSRTHGEGVFSNEFDHFAPTGELSDLPVTLSP